MIFEQGSPGGKLARGLAGWASLLVLVACSDGAAEVATPPLTGQPDAARPKAPSWQPLAPQERFEGRALTDVALGWVQWCTAPDHCELPFNDEDGSKCALYQSDSEPLFFLQSGYATSVRTRCKIPAGKAIVVPVIAYFTDLVGRGPEVSAADLPAEADRIHGSIRDETLVIDGMPVEGLRDWLVSPQRGSYTLPPPPNLYACSPGGDDIEGTIDPVYYGGIFVILPPPEPGHHTLDYGGTLTNPFAVDERMFVKAEFEVE